MASPTLARQRALAALAGGHLVPATAIAGQATLLGLHTARSATTGQSRAHSGSSAHPAGPSPSVILAAYPSGMDVNADGWEEVLTFEGSSPFCEGDLVARSGAHGTRLWGVPVHNLMQGCPSISDGVLAIPAAGKQGPMIVVVTVDLSKPGFIHQVLRSVDPATGAVQWTRTYDGSWVVDSKGALTSYTNLVWGVTRTPDVSGDHASDLFVTTQGYTPLGVGLGITECTPPVAPVTECVDGPYAQRSMSAEYLAGRSGTVLATLQVTGLIGQPIAIPSSNIDGKGTPGFIYLDWVTSNNLVLRAVGLQGGVPAWAQAVNVGGRSFITWLSSFTLRGKPGAGVLIEPLVLGSSSEMASAYDGSTGSVLWAQNIGDFSFLQPIGDANADSTDDFTIAQMDITQSPAAVTDTTISGLNGTQLWSISNLRTNDLWTSVQDLNGDGILDIVDVAYSAIPGTKDGFNWVQEAISGRTGLVLWTRTGTGHRFVDGTDGAMPIGGDLDQDGQGDLYTTSFDMPKKGPATLAVNLFDGADHSPEVPVRMHVPNLGWIAWSWPAVLATPHGGSILEVVWSGSVSGKGPYGTTVISAGPRGESWRLTGPPSGPGPF